MGILSLLRPLSPSWTSDKELYRAIYSIFGFYPSNIMPYKLALHHKSAPLEISVKQHNIGLNNERLEFLGDAIIGAIVADIVFKSFPYKNEGFMSEMRSKIVSRSQLNKLSIHLGIDKLVQHQHDIRSKSIEGDAFEALFGAIYIDKGFEFSKKVLKRIINLNFDLHELESQNNNFKSQLLEWSQKNKHELDYKVIDTQYDKKIKVYVVRVFIDGKPMETGSDYNIKGAEQIASQKTLEIITKGTENTDNGPIV